MRIKLETLADLLGSTSGGGDVNDGRAGGTVTLWAVNAHGLVVCLTDLDGPFCPSRETNSVNVAGFTIGVYANEDDFLDGGDPVLPLVEVKAGPGLHALAEALTRACATTTGDHR